MSASVRTGGGPGRLRWDELVRHALKRPVAIQRANMTPQRRRLLISGVVVGAVAIAVVLSVLSLPIAQESSGYTQIGGRLYSFESVQLFDQPTAWPNLTYRGVTFAFHLWCGEPTPGGAEICGNATEAGGAHYAYAFWDGPPSHPPRWETWVAPDGHEAVQYQEGGLAHLLVQT